MAARGEEDHRFRVCDDDREYRMLLARKLCSEAAEAAHESVHGDKHRITGELADVLEAVVALGEFHGITSEQIRLRAQVKYDQQGGFGGRVVWEGREDEEPPQ